MSNNFVRKTTAGILALTLLGSAVPAAPLADSLNIFSAITAKAEDEAKTYAVDYNPNTKEACLSGILPECSSDISELSEIKNEVVKISCQPGTVFGEDCSNMFDEFQALETVDFTKADFSKVKKASCLFRKDFKLKSVNLSQTDFSSVTDLHQMFYYCTVLKDIIGLKSSSQALTDISGLFNDCQSLAEIDVSQINTGNVTNFSSVFFNCYDLNSLDLSSFDTSNAILFDYMFKDCYNIRTLDLKNFDTSKAQKMDSMFGSCHSAISIDVSSFDTQNVENMADMFFDCWALKQLDLSGFKTEKCTNYSRMFSSCTSLRELDLSGFVIDYTDTTTFMLNAYSLRKLKLGDGIGVISKDMWLPDTENGWVNEANPDKRVSFTEEYREIIYNEGENTYIKNPNKGKFTGSSIEINNDGTIGLRIIASLPDNLSDEEIKSAFICFSSHIGKRKKENIIVKQDKNGDYYAIVRIAAKEMADTFWIKLNVGGQDVDTWYYSVRQYADQILANPETYAKEQDLIKTMLLYGGAAQRHFDHNTHSLNVPLIDAGINFSKTVINDAHYFVKPSDINGISYYGSSIILGSGVVQRHYFKLNNSTAADYKFIVDGTDVVPTRYMETNYYYVDADKNAPAMKLYTPSSISVFKNSNPAEKMEFNYSVMDYVRNAKSDSTMAATALDVIRTLSWMADEAKAYFENK